MRPNIVIQTTDNLQIDQFSSCILVDFSYEIEDLREVFLTQDCSTSKSIRIGVITNWKSFNKKKDCLSIEYEPPLYVLGQFLKMSA